MKARKWIGTVGISADDAMRLSRELIEQVYKPDTIGLDLINQCRKVISIGIETLRISRLSVTFRHAVDVSLEERDKRRSRTKYEIKHICRRLMEQNKELAELKLRDISVIQCKEMLGNCFHTPSQFIKARAVLHSIFACGVRHGWCSANPVDGVPRPDAAESEIEPLQWCDIKKLMHTARQEQFAACMPAVGIMLWAGVRPAELERMEWSDIDWQEKIINLRPRHTKTGGCRHITMHPVLIAWLKKVKDLHEKSGRICPPNWAHKWKALRHAAGIIKWQQDVLRHTFASYHLKHWHDLNKLQEEMGHRSSRLLRTRYLSMKGISRHHVKLFWTPGVLG